MALISTYIQTLFQRQTPQEQPTWLIIIGIASIAVYAFCRTGFDEIASVASIIATLTGFWGLYKYGRIVNSHVFFRFVWIAIFIQLISWGLSEYTTPEWAENYPKLDKMTRWFVFIPLAWWVAQRQNAIWLIWGSAALGILVSPWTTGEGLSEIIRGIGGSRIDFGIRNAQHTALFFGSILIGLCCFTKPLYKCYKLSLIPALLLISYCLLVIYINESRQAWLALIITLVALSFYLVLQRFKQSSRRKQLLLINFFILGLIAFGSFLVTNDKIVKRVMVDKETISAVAEMSFDDVPYSSFGIRFHSWMAASDFILKKPLFGWGHNGQSLVMEKTEWLPDWVKNGFGHLHNSYLEILVNYGLVGLFFYFSIWIIIGKMLFREINSGRVEKEFGYLFIAILLFWGVMNCFESYQNFWTGVFYFNVFMTGIMAKIWHRKLKRDIIN